MSNASCGGTPRSLQVANVDFRTSVLVSQLQPNGKEPNKVEIIFWGNKEKLMVLSNSGK